MAKPLPLSRAYFNAQVSQLKQSVEAHCIKISPSQLAESLICAYGFSKLAAFDAELKNGNSQPAQGFDHWAFISRLAELTDYPTATTVGALVDGASMTVQIDRYSKERQRSHKYTHIAYDISLQIHNAKNGDCIFQLPEFFSREGFELYRVDAAHDRRLANDPYRAKSRSPSRNALRTFTVDGKWNGGLYIYSSSHQDDDMACKRSVTAALTRAVLPLADGRFHCNIYQPEHFQFGVWRVELDFGKRSTRMLGNETFTFKIPQFPGRFWRVDTQHLAAGDFGIAKVVDGHWEGIVQTNGMEEADNPTPIAEVRRTIYIAAQNLLRNAEAFNTNV